MTNLTLHPALAPDHVSGVVPPVGDESHLAESAYRAVAVLRADPRLAAQALPPDAYLAALDCAAESHRKETQS